jgi:hypothetical protein
MWPNNALKYKERFFYKTLDLRIHPKTEFFDQLLRSLRPSAAGNRAVTSRAMTSKVIGDYGR